MAGEKRFGVGALADETTTPTGFYRLGRLVSEPSTSAGCFQADTRQEMMSVPSWPKADRRRMGTAWWLLERWTVPQSSRARVKMRSAKVLTRPSKTICRHRGRRLLVLVTRLKRAVVLAVVSIRYRVTVALADFQIKQRRRYACLTTAGLGVILSDANEEIAALVGRIEQQTLSLVVRQAIVARDVGGLGRRLAIREYRRPTGPDTAACE